MNLSILLAFGAMIGWGVGDFLIQRTVKKIGVLETLFCIAFISSFLLLPFIAKDIPTLTSSNWIFLIILGLIGFVSGRFFVKALEIGKLSVMEVILSLELPLTILLGIIFFKESLNWWQIILIIILFIGVILIAVDFKQISRKDLLEKGSFFAIATAVVVSLVNFLSADASKNISPLMAICLPWFICGLVCFGFILKDRRWRSFFNDSLLNWRLVLWTIIIDTLAWVAYVFAVQKESLSITISITESFIVIALVLGLVFNKEKISRVQYLGAILAVVGSILIGFVK